MKNIIRLLIITALCCISLPSAAQGKGEGLQRQAQESLTDKDYIRARYMFLQAYNAYMDAGQYAQGVACGVQAGALYHRENYYKEAFELLYKVEQNIIEGERKTGNQMPALRYPVTRERLQMYIKLRNAARAKEQLAKLQGWAESAQVDSLSTDLLYTQANYYYTFGQNQQGDAAFNALVQRYAQQKDYDKARACYQEMIGMGRRSGSTALVARAYDKYMAWNDSIRAIEAQEKYNDLKAQYEASLQTIAEKDDSLAARQYTIIGLCVLALILAAALVLGGIVLLRYIMQTRKQKKVIETVNEHNALKTQFIRNISAQMKPTLDTLDASQPGVRALSAFSDHIEELSALEDTLTEPYELEEVNVSAFCEGVMDQIRGTEKEGVALTVNAPKLTVKLNKEHVAKILVPCRRENLAGLQEAWRAHSSIRCHRHGLRHHRGTARQPLQAFQRTERPYPRRRPRPAHLLAGSHQDERQLVVGHRLCQRGAVRVGTARMTRINLFYYGRHTILTINP